jgi:hypothetical protein
LNDVVERRQEVIINNGHDENIIIDQDHEENVIINDDREENIIIMDDREQNLARLNNHDENIIIDNHNDNIIIEPDFEDDESESDSNEEEEEQIPQEEALIRYALTLDVPGTAAANNRPARAGEGNVEINEKNQLDTHARMLIVVYACAFMGYKNPANKKAARGRIATAASTLVCYDLGYRKVMGKTMLERWIKELEQSARVQGHRIGLKSKHKGKVGGTFVA